MKVLKMTALSWVLATSAGSFAAMAAETAQVTVKGAVNFHTGTTLSLQYL
jgi:hypothetical protein